MDSKPRKKNRLLTKGFKALAVIVIASIVLLLIFTVGFNKLKTAEINTTEISLNQNTSETIGTTEPDVKSTVRMMCAGDNLVHSSIYKQAKDRSQNGSYDFTYAYKQVEDILALSDFAVLNQETLINKDKEPSNFPLFNSPPELGEHMIKIGFTVINHANNHVLDQGVSGAFNTIEFWKSHKGILLTGLYRDDNDMNEIKTNTVNGITFSHLGFTEYLNGLQLPSSSSLRVVSLSGANMSTNEFYSTMKRMVEAADAKSDVVCVSVHFKQEDILTPSATQEEIVAKLVDYGADVIIGTGPHVLQPMKFVERDDGSRVLVIYSLGNFISAQAKAANMVAGIADVTFVKSGLTGKTEVVSAGLIPTVTQYGSGCSNVHIIPFTDYSEEQAAVHGVRKFQPQYNYDFVKNLLETVIGSDWLTENWRQ